MEYKTFTNNKSMLRSTEYDLSVMKTTTTTIIILLLSITFWVGIDEKLLQYQILKVLWNQEIFINCCRFGPKSSPNKAIKYHNATFSQLM